MAYTPEQEQKIFLVRLYIGDTPTSPFYQIFTDEEIGSILEYRGWNLQKAIRDCAIAASMQFAQMTYRERTGDIEVWNDWANAYRKALETFIKDPNFNVPNAIAYAGGTSKADMLANDANNDNVRQQIYQGFSDGIRVYNTDNSTDDDARYRGE